MSGELSAICGQLKLYADDDKKYLSDVISEEGVRLLLKSSLQSIKSNSRLDKGLPDELTLNAKYSLRK